MTAPLGGSPQDKSPRASTGQQSPTQHVPPQDSSLLEPRDPLLDALLDEVLGGCRPPDLSLRIVQALADRQQVAPRPILLVPTSDLLGNGPGSILPAPILPASILPAPRSHDVPAATKAGRRRRVSAIYWYSLAASLLVLGVGYWALGDWMLGNDRHTKHLAQDNRHGTVGIAPHGRVERASEAKQGQTSLPNVGKAGAGEPGGNQPGGNQPAERLGSPKLEVPAADVAATQSAVSPVADAPATVDAASESRRDRVPDQHGRDADTVAGLSNRVTSSAATDNEIIAYINGRLRQRWQDSDVRPSPSATDAEWCRRVFLDLVGRIPTIEELEAFLVDHTRDKRAGLVDRLLGDDYVEAYARHWMTIWTNLLIGRSGGMLPDSLVNREGLQQYLRRSFLSNKPYDRLVYELVSAQGSNLPGEDDFNGAVNFLLDNLQEKAATATAKTAQLFLGLQIQCTQCHNHPFNEWKQNRFWELNAFFRQAKAAQERRGNELRLVRLGDEDFIGEGAMADPRGAQGADPAEAEIYYELRNGEMRVAYPVFVDGTPIDPNGSVSVVNRRDELARLMVRSEYLGQAIVNRLWGHFFGYGFTKPMDDLGRHNLPSHPELLSRLGHDFASTGHDLKRLIRWITLSEAYSLSSKFGPKQGNQSDDPTLGVPPLFSHFYLRQMTVEQLYDSLLVATEAHRAASGGGLRSASGGGLRSSYEEQQRTKDQWAQQFTIAFGTDDNGEATTFDGTITQTLVMMNGELTRRATDSQAGGFLGRLVELAGNPGRRAAAPINQMYQAALGRRPSKSELNLANELLAARGGNAVSVLEDVWWALLNSNEFILNH